MKLHRYFQVNVALCYKLLSSRLITVDAPSPLVEYVTDAALTASHKGK